MRGDTAKGLKPDQIKNWLADADLDPPFGVSADRWESFLIDARRFVADGWLDRAVKLEWLDQEVFGVDPDQPFDNPAPGRTGLVTALAGRAVLGLHPDYATVKNINDDDGRLHSRWLQVVSRHAKQKPLVLIWDWKPPIVRTSTTIEVDHDWIQPPPAVQFSQEKET
jgi:hypothetical protein